MIIVGCTVFARLALIYVLSVAPAVTLTNVIIMLNVLIVYFFLVNNLLY
jgi:hypothetical protein